MSTFRLLKTCILLLLLTTTAQGQLYVGPGSTLYIPAGSTLQVDSLMLVPAATLALSNNRIDKRHTPEWAPGTGHATISQVYTVDTPFNFQGTATVIYSDAGLNGNTAGALSLLYAPEIADSPGFAPSSMVNTTTRMVSATFPGPQRIGKFSAGNGATPLPVTLLSFDAWPDGGRAKLLWKVASETDCAAYIMERSADGRHFTRLFQTPAAGGPAGELQYLRYDEQPLEPNNYYRLASIGRDGRPAYHGIRKVMFRGGSDGLQLSAWPIPTERVLHLSFSAMPPAGSELTLYDVAGRPVLRGVCKGIKAELNLGSLSSGSYILRCTGVADALRVEKR